MRRHSLRIFLAVSVLATGLYLVAGDVDVQWALWHVLLVATVAAVLLGPRIHRPASRGPWRLLAAGMATMALSATTAATWWSPSTQAAREDIAGILLMLGYPLVGLCAARFARAQSGGKDHGPLLDSAVVTVAATTVLWELVLTRYAGTDPDPRALGSMLVVALAASWVAAMTTRLLLAGGYRTPSGWLLFGGSIGGMVGSVGFLLGGPEGGLTGGWVDAAWAASLILTGCAALHPSMVALARPQEDLDHAHTWVRTILLTIALMAPPSAMLVRLVTTGEAAVVSAAASLVVAAIVALRFVDLVRQRERASRDSARRAAREGVLARLGERGLAGAPVGELLREAEDLLGRELDVKDFRLTAGEAPSSRARELPGGAGLVWYETREAVDLAADAATFVSALGHVLAAAVARRLAEDELRHQSMHDPLTGLANRMLLDERIRHALGRRLPHDETVAVLFLDLDGFKAVNDQYGHGAGDDLLRAVADRLLDVVRSADTVARFAGDEFVVVLEGVDDGVAQALAERMREALRKPFRLAGGSVTVTITGSVGVALAGPEDREPDDLLLRADAAMYREKRAVRERAEEVVRG